MNKLDMESKDIVRDNLEYIKERFPEAVTEENGKLKLNPDSLIQSLSSVIIDDKKEKYELTWPGKKQAIVEGNTRTTKTLRPLKDKSVDFDKAENIYIEGDNLETLKILQESYLNKIKCIYIDPPYNTGKDFIYKDNYNKDEKDELIDSGQIDENGNRLVSNNQANGRFHSDWLSMMYPRLKLARNLLTKDGLIFISIDDNEQENMKKMCNEIFGENNFVGTLIRKVMEGGKSDSKGLAIEHEYCHVYCKNNYDGVYKKEAGKLDHYNKKDDYFEERGYYYLKPLESGGLGYVPSLDYPIKGPDGVDIYPGDYSGDNGYRWVWGKDKFQNALNKGMIEFTKSSKDNTKYKVYYKIYEKVDTDGNPTIKELPFGTLYLDGFTNRQAINDLKKIFDNNRVFDYPKPVSFLKEILKIGSKDKDIVMDFFSGSGSFAQAVLELNKEENVNRNFILIQIPDSIGKESNEYKTLCDIGEDRIRKCININGLKEGLRVYKIDESNMKDEFYMTPDKISQEQIRLFEDNIKEDRTPDDLITQVLLNLGLKLDLPIEEKNICGNKVFDVDDGELLACFDNNVSIDIIEEIAKINPRQVVFRDSSFATDQEKVNFEERLKRLSAGTKFNVL